MTDVRVKADLGKLSDCVAYSEPRIAENSPEGSSEAWKEGERLGDCSVKRRLDGDHGPGMTYV
jgi:hypothetical protein